MNYLQVVQDFYRPPLGQFSVSGNTHTPCQGVHNNTAEGAIKPFVIGRKAWLFSDTPKGATASAQICSLVETGKANGQEPYTWLRHVLERLPQAASSEHFEALLAWNCSPEMPQ